MHSATIFFALIAVASAVGVGHHDIHAHPAYRSSYAVSDKHTGDQKSHSEVRDGGVTKGSYSLVQPDGVVRQVNYIVTPHGGFQAQVLNKGVAGHPAGWGWSGAGRGADIVGAGVVGARGLGLGAGLAGGWGGANSVVDGAIGSPVVSGGWGAGLGLGAGIGINAGLGGSGILG